MSEELSEKLDILIKLQAAALTSSFESTKDKILFLNKAGLRPKLIADIVGTSPNHVLQLLRERVALLLDRPVTVPSTPLVDPPERPGKTARGCLPLDHPETPARPRPIMAKAQQLKTARSRPLIPLLALLR